ncbi:FlxA-like family protein [Dickeya fangzhongdai]|uniref:FlxA-like family protein n=1 Tax=Dickeya fangzhongdai TaxID=1778540 RepID=UPI0004F6644C|nr:FlxA-like family protein [Dickeya fangzhongdai]AIR70830.1 Myb [Dickeya fangzhongdai]KGT99034.1 Myb [Dickeya fangzhongdai]WPD74948.1 FlxA-like family protein [Dickeya fangzhongdai]
MVSSVGSATSAVSGSAGTSTAGIEQKIMQLTKQIQTLTKDLSKTVAKMLEAKSDGERQLLQQQQKMVQAQIQQLQQQIQQLQQQKAQQQSQSAADAVSSQIDKQEKANPLSSDRTIDTYI